MTIPNAASYGQSYVDVIDETSSLGDAFVAGIASPPTRPIERFREQDRFRAAVAFGVLFRDRARLQASEAIEEWNWRVCDPPLFAAELNNAIFAAFDEPAIAARIIGEPAQAPRDGAAEAPPDTKALLTPPKSVGKPPKDKTAAERQRRYRERRKLAAVTPAPAVTGEGPITPDTVTPGAVVTDATVTATEVA